MSTINLGRVQGGGFFASTSDSVNGIAKTSVLTVVGNKIEPLLGDVIVNANGDLCLIEGISETAYTVRKFGSIRGAKGVLEGTATVSLIALESEKASGYTKGGDIDRELKELKRRLTAVEGGN